MRLHRVFARLGLPSAKIQKNRGKTGGRTFGKVEDHQIRLFQPGRRAAQDLFQERRGTSVRRRSLLGSPCDDGSAVSRPLLSRPDQNAVSQTGCLNSRGCPPVCAEGLNWIETRPVDINLRLTLAFITVGSARAESGNLSALPPFKRFGQPGGLAADPSQEAKPPRHAISLIAIEWPEPVRLSSSPK